MQHSMASIQKQDADKRQNQGSSSEELENLRQYRCLPTDAFTVINNFLVPIRQAEIDLTNVLSINDDNRFFLCIGQFLMKYKSMHMFSIRPSGSASNSRYPYGLVYRPVGYCLRWQRKIFQRSNNSRDVINLLGKLKCAADVQAAMLLRKWFPSVKSYCGLSRETVGNHLRLNYALDKAGSNDSLIHEPLGDNDLALLCNELKDNTYIKILWLTNNRIGDEGAIELATKVLPHNQVLERINLYNNKISDRGGLAFARALRANDVIQRFCLIGNNISMSVLREIAEAWNNRSEYLALYTRGQQPRA